jgi:hypothetical protein
VAGAADGGGEGGEAPGDAGTDGGRLRGRRAGGGALSADEAAWDAQEGAFRNTDLDASGELDEHELALALRQVSARRFGRPCAAARAQKSRGLVLEAVPIRPLRRARSGS